MSLRSGFYGIQENCRNVDELLNFLRQRDFRPLLPCYLRLLHLYRECGRFVSIVCIVAKTFSLSRPIQRNFRPCAVALFSNFSQAQKRYWQTLRYDIILRVYAIFLENIFSPQTIQYYQKYYIRKMIYNLILY